MLRPEARGLDRCQTPQCVVWSARLASPQHTITHIPTTNTRNHSTAFARESQNLYHAAISVGNPPKVTPQVEFKRRANAARGRRCKNRVGRSVRPARPTQRQYTSHKAHHRRRSSSAMNEARAAAYSVAGTSAACRARRSAAAFAFFATRSAAAAFFAFWYLSHAMCSWRVDPQKSQKVARGISSI